MQKNRQLTCLLKNKSKIPPAPPGHTAVKVFSPISADLIFEAPPGHALYGSQESHRILPGEVQKLSLGQNRIRFEKMAGAAAAAADTLLDDFYLFRKTSKNEFLKPPPTDLRRTPNGPSHRPGFVDPWISGFLEKPQKSSLRENRIRSEKMAGAAAADTLYDDYETFRKT